MNITKVSGSSGSVLVIDSRLIAERLGIQHDNFVQTVEKYKTQAEQAFGSFLFQTETKKRAVGATVVRFYLLTEDQATFIMSLSRNTPEVVQCKLDLVVAFSKAKSQLKTEYNPQWFKRLVLFRSKTKIPTGWFCIFEEMSMALMADFEDAGYSLPDKAVPDISIGKCFCKHLRSLGYDTTKGGRYVRGYTHRYPDGRTPEANIYANEILPLYREWFTRTYKPQNLPAYLKGQNSSVPPSLCAALGLPEGSI